MILVIDGHSYLYEMESLCDIFFPYEKEVIAARKKLATAGFSPKSALVILKGTDRPLDGWEHDFFRRSIAPAGVFWSLTAACFLGWR